MVAARYTSSPVGPYLELALAEPARLGARPGMTVTTMVVDSAASRASGRERWGFPKELGRLHWSEQGDERSLRWEERGVVMRWLASGAAVPVLLPYVTLQCRASGPLWAPGRVRGSAQKGCVEVTAPADDEMSFLAGAHRGAHFSNVVLRMGDGRPIRTAGQPTISASKTDRIGQ